MDELVRQSSTMSFAHAADHFDGLAPERTAEIFGQAADVTLVIDESGVIQDASFAISDLFSGGGNDWRGKKWEDTVTIECKAKVAEILEEAREGKTIRPREINHSMPSGDDVPIRYSAVRLDQNGSVIVFGRDISRVATLQQKLMNSQLAIEREFARLRSGEMRYRMMFQLGGVPQVVIDTSNLRVSDANPAALKLLGMEPRQVENVKVSQLFDSNDKDALEKLLLATINSRAEDEVKIALRGGEVITIGATLFQQERRGYLLLNLSSNSGNVVPLTYAVERRILDLIEQMPDAFVVMNEDRRILAANNALIDLLNLPSLKDVEGQLFDTWFERAGVDCNVLMANVKEHGSVRRFATVLRGGFDRSESVEIAATKIENVDETLYGFLIRPVPAPLAISDTETEVVPRSNEQITNLVGHMPLKDIVRETTSMIEQLCIDAALDLTSGNRVSAARMLGLSRQSLYAKLAKDKD